MFWRVASGSVSSSVEAILSRESFTLKQLLAEDELVKEIKLPNEQLMDFLLLDKTLTELMHHLVDAPSEELEEDEKFNIPSAACEVLCCESAPILDAVVRKPTYLNILFTPPERPQPTDSVMAGFFARVIACLISHRASNLMEWLQENKERFIALTERLENTGIAESIVRLVGADEQTSSSLSPDQLEWISDTAMLPTLLDKLEGREGAVIAENAAEVLAAIARARTPPLTYVLGSPENIGRLLELCTGQGRPGRETQLLVQALTICIALVERQILWHIAHQGGSAGPMADKDHELEGQAVQVLAPKAAQLLKQLSEGEQREPLETPYGLQPPLGSARLTVVALIAVLLRTGLSSAEEAVMEADLLSLCLTLFLSYPFNSILHHKVSSILGCALEIGSDSLVAHVFNQCNLLHWLVNAPAEVTAKRHPEDSRKRAPLRAGYTGHLTQIATKIAEAAETRPLIAEQLELHQGWRDFALERLQQAHQMEDLNAWECGRPVVSEKPPGSSDADDHLGLDGEALNGALPSFDQNSFGIQSAFRVDSDSDEDSPRRAEALFADAMDYEDDYDHLSNGLNGMNNSWEDENKGDSPKGFSQRQRLEVYEDSPGDELDRVMNGAGPSEAGPQLQQVPHSWGCLLNGHLPNPADSQRGVSEPVDSWESLAADEPPDPPKRSQDDAGDENRSPQSSLARCDEEWCDGQRAEPAVPGQTPGLSRQDASLERSEHQGQASGQERDLTGSESVSSSIPGSSPPGMGHSPLQQALHACRPADTLAGSSGSHGSSPGKQAGPAIDQAEFRQPSQADQGSSIKAVEDQDGFVLRYIDECASDRDPVSDKDAHPMGKAGSDDSDDVSQEIGECLADSEMLEPEGRKPEQPHPRHASEREEQTLVGSFTKLDVEPSARPNHGTESQAAGEEHKMLQEGLLPNEKAASG